MNNIFEKLFQYGFHDTEISSMECENLEIKLNFDEGIYLLDETGTETILSKPMQVILHINPYVDSYERVIEIIEYGRKTKTKYLDYAEFQKYLKKETFEIMMVYYSKFCSCILFDGGFFKKDIMLSIGAVDDIIFQELKKW